VRSESFKEHFSQATLFWNSQSNPEKDHLVAAFQFELSKVEIPALRERIVTLLTNVDLVLAERVAADLGLRLPPDANKRKAAQMQPPIEVSAALSMANTPRIRLSLARLLFSSGTGLKYQASIY